MDTITRKAAKELGIKRYFTGKPCKRGHIAERYTCDCTCIECQKEHYQENKEHIAAYYKEYYEDNKEQLSAQQKEYKKSNKEQILAQQKEYYDENKEQRLAYQKKWRSHNPESLISYNHKRRSKTKTGEPATVIREWVKAQPKICYWCHTKCTKDNYHIDHYIPLSKGGLHTINNLRISCQRCNLSKNAKDPYEFAKSKGRLF